MKFYVGAVIWLVHYLILYLLYHLISEIPNYNSQGALGAPSSTPGLYLWWWIYFVTTDGTQSGVSSVVGQSNWTDLRPDLTQNQKLRTWLNPVGHSGITTVSSAFHLFMPKSRSGERRHETKYSNHYVSQIQICLQLTQVPSKTVSLSADLRSDSSSLFYSCLSTFLQPLSVLCKLSGSISGADHLSEEAAESVGQLKITAHIWLADSTGPFCIRNEEEEEEGWMKTSMQGWGDSTLLSETSDWLITFKHITGITNHSEATLCLLSDWLLKCWHSRPVKKTAAWIFYKCLRGFTGPWVSSRNLLEGSRGPWKVPPSLEEVPGVHRFL